MANGGTEREIPPIKYEYLDHPADVQLHSYGDGGLGLNIHTTAYNYVICGWCLGCMNLFLYVCGGDSLKEAFEQVAMAMFNYMTTNYDTVEMTDVQEVEAEGDDMLGLLYHFLDEWLFTFSAENFFFPRVIEITEFDKDNFKIKSKGYGEPFDISKHPQGTEVKAITYSNMQIHDEDENEKEIFVIIDI